MNLTTFKIQFPELSRAGDGLLQAMLDAASLEIDTTVWGPKADQGQAYLAAHKLALSPFGQNARLVTVSKLGGYGTSTYYEHYMSLVRQVASGYRVL